MADGSFAELMLVLPPTWPTRGTDELTTSSTRRGSPRSSTRTGRARRPRRAGAACSGAEPELAAVAEALDRALDEAGSSPSSCSRSASRARICSGSLAPGVGEADAGADGEHAQHAAARVGGRELAVRQRPRVDRALGLGRPRRRRPARRRSRRGGWGPGCSSCLPGVFGARRRVPRPVSSHVPDERGVLSPRRARRAPPGSRRRGARPPGRSSASARPRRAGSAAARGPGSASTSSRTATTRSETAIGSCTTVARPCAVTATSPPASSVSAQRGSARSRASDSRRTASASRTARGPARTHVETGMACGAPPRRGQHRDGAGLPVGQRRRSAPPRRLALEQPVALLQLRHRRRR